MSREAPTAASAAAPSPARFRADVLRQYDSVASAAMNRVLSHLGADVDDQATLDVLVARVPSAFFPELIDRALHACVEHLCVDGDNPLAEGVVRRMGHLVRALDIGDDDEVWYYIGYSLMGYTITALDAIADQFVVPNDGESWTDAMSRLMEHFVDRVSRLLLDGALRQGMHTPERCMQRLTWRSLYSALEIEQLKQWTGVAGADMDAHEAEWRAGDAATAAKQRRQEEVDQRAYRPRAIPFLDSNQLTDLEAAILSPDLLARLELAWDAPFVRMDAANTRNALHAQNVLGLAGRDGRRAPLHADAATTVARFLAPAAIPASELVRQQAAYVASVDRNRAQTDVDRAIADVERAHQRRRDADERNALRQRELWTQATQLRTTERLAMDQVERDRTRQEQASARAGGEMAEAEDENGEWEGEGEEAGDMDEDEEEEDGEDGGGMAAAAANDW